MYTVSFFNSADETEKEKEKRVVLAVFGALLRRNDTEYFLGTETIADMKEIYYKLRYEKYCKRRGITFEEMTEEDFIDAYEHEYC